MSNQDRLVEAANAFLEIYKNFENSSPEEIIKIVELFQKYPELLESKMDSVFQLKILDAKKQEKEDVVQSIEQCYLVLKMLPLLYEKFIAKEQGTLQNQDQSVKNLYDLCQNAANFHQTYVSSGNENLLDKAIEVWNQIFQHPAFKIASLNLQILIINDSANSYLWRYRAKGNLSDLTTAINSWETVVEKTPQDSPNLPDYLSNLSIGLNERYGRLNDLHDLQRGIDICRQAVIKAKQHSLPLSHYFNSLGLGLTSRYVRLGNLQDLEESIKYNKQTVDLTQQNSPDLAGRLNNLGNGLRDRYERLGEIKDLEKGKETFKQALQLNKNAPIANLLGAACNWLNWAFERNSLEEMEESYQVIENTNLLLLKEQLSREHQNIFLEKTQGVATKIAHSRIQRNDLKQAVESLEQGAARLLTAKLLKANPSSSVLVYLFATEKGGYALIVFQKEIKDVFLPKLTTTDLDEKLQPYINRCDFQLENFKSWRDKIEETTNWFWKEIWQPIINLLPKEKTQVTLIPNGLLNLLPLHLAWTQKGDKKHYILDDFVINYAPNAFFLETAKKRAKAAKQRAFLKPKLLAIDNSLGDLPSSSVEVKNIAKHFSNATVLSQHNATLEKVKNELEKDYNILHFSCHGSANLENPLETALIMANQEKLTVQDFLNAKLNARLVTLSACETGMIGIKLPEEVVNLPASLLQAGVAGVVASLWAVNDFSTALLMIKFYENFAQQSDNIALSLQQAQHWLRDSTREQLQNWAKQKSLPYSLQDQLEISTENPSDKPYQSPYYWGAFYATGI